MPAVDADANKVGIKKGMQLQMIYVAKLDEAMCLLHAFCKNTRRVWVPHLPWRRAVSERRNQDKK